MGLRKGQRELVEEYRGGFCAVPAIPGGGKTHSLSLWAVEMIAAGLNKPGKILIVTYMNSAVNNFKQRIANELQKRGIGGKKSYFVSTIHGLCLQIIKEKPDLILANEEFEIIDPVNKVHMISGAIDEWRRHNEDRFKFFIDDKNLSANKIAQSYKSWQDKLAGVIIATIGDFKARGLDSASSVKLCSKMGDKSLLKIASEIYELYDKRLKIGGFFDFDDMLYNAKKLLEEDENLLESYRKKYTFVCEDEAQDSNSIQSEILGLIANGNFLRVGDSNQAICGSFTSSDFKLFKEFCDREETTVHSITESSRNTKEIIDVANFFVKYVRDTHPQLECRDSLLPQYIETVDPKDPFTNPKTEEYGIRAKVFSSWEEEVNNVTFQVVNSIKTHPDKTIALLVPSAYKMNDFIKLFDAKKVPYELLDNSSAERNKTVKTLGRIIDYIAFPENGEKLYLMMMECLLTDEYEVEKTEEGEVKVDQKYLLAKFLKKCKLEKILYPQGGEIDKTDLPEDLVKHKIWSDFLDKIDLVRELLEFPSTVVEKLILYIGEKLNFGREERAIAQKVASDIRYLMSQNPRWRLSDLALELLSPKNMFNFFSGVVWELKGYEPKPGVVTIVTYHKSKGPEWGTVFLTGVSFSDFPVTVNDKFVGEYYFLKESYKNPQALIKAELDRLLNRATGEDFVLKSKLETIAERARLLYVGITRAKEYLFLSAHKMNEGKRNEVMPSKYLEEIKKFTEEEYKKWKKI